MSYLPEGGAYKEKAEGANHHGPPLLFLTLNQGTIKIFCVNAKYGIQYGFKYLFNSFAK